MHEFSVLAGKHIVELLDGREREVIDWVEAAYLAHDAGSTVNPDSYFLRFPEKPDARIIALPAFLGGEDDVAGIKWISSFPANTESGLPRASAVLVLNDYRTGYPFALLESAGISAARTAASAALAATALGAGSARTVGIVGAGVIARTIARYLAAAGIGLTDVVCHDLDDASAGALAEHLAARHGSGSRTGSLAEALGCDLVVLATTALSPYIGTEHTLRGGQVVLNVSLRDIEPELLLTAQNFVDDVDHCLKANTSPHLAEQRLGDRSFIDGTLADVLRGRVALDPQRPLVFSPFGLGVLDLAVGHRLFQRARQEGRLTEVPGFFGETRRW
ncbi:2,3-diaminopropionate biosynthesis protein SbnB [Streptomyces xanthochromogenes]|uniref:2,3-diaminopropionate biosynthesis protein SbnB n=1 Tax=Streptomyces xanthochromogenes TaxID=67384 RepID=UPI00167B6B6E|nr:2,3-diaminopropionate biosynthesis protein SbnB [Streptomyces xanthochromogenes]GHB35066.1 2,3-diaminopropionate biosynthesis protein SbnB [Streptomyces xanthochromogenes]